MMDVKVVSVDNQGEHHICTGFTEMDAPLLDQDGKLSPVWKMAVRNLTASGNKATKIIFVVKIPEDYFKED